MPDIPLFDAPPRSRDDTSWTTQRLPAWATPASAAGDPGDRSRDDDSADTAGVDWDLVRRLKSTVVTDMTSRRDAFRATHGREPGIEDKKQMARPIIDTVVQNHAAKAAATSGATWDGAMIRRYSKAVLDSQLGHGRIEPLLHLATAEDIVIAGTEKVVARHNDGRITHHSPVADSVEELIGQLKIIGELATPKRTLDASHIDMTVMLRDRFRLHAISDEVAVTPRVVIRQHLLKEVSLLDLADLGMMPPHVALLLHAAIQAGQSIVVAGAQGSGKTTTLRAMIDAIPAWEFFGTLETDIELFAHLMPQRRHNLALVSRSGMGERDEDGNLRGQVGISSLVDPALRQTLDRLIVGEARGPEASALLQAMQVGTGTLSTTHAKNATTVPDRLAGRVAADHVYTKAEALDEIGHCIDLIVYISVDYAADGRKRRYISDIRTVAPGDPTKGPGGIVRPTLGQVYKAASGDQPELFSPTPELQALLAHHSLDDLHRYRAPGQEVRA